MPRLGDDVELVGDLAAVEGLPPAHGLAARPVVDADPEGLADGQVVGRDDAASREASDRPRASEIRWTVGDGAMQRRRRAHGTTVSSNDAALEVAPGLGLPGVVVEEQADAHQLVPARSR